MLFLFYLTCFFILFAGRIVINLNCCCHHDNDIAELPRKRQSTPTPAYRPQTPYRPLNFTDTNLFVPNESTLVAPSNSNPPQPVDEDTTINIFQQNRPVASDGRHGDTIDLMETPKPNQKQQPTPPDNNVTNTKKNMPSTSTQEPVKEKVQDVTPQTETPKRLQPPPIKPKRPLSRLVPRKKAPPKYEPETQSLIVSDGEDEVFAMASQLF